MPEGVDGTPGGNGGALGLGLDPKAEEQLIATITTMFGMKIMNEQRQEDREMFPEEGTQ